jgi:uncharacterized protein (DUF2461 family)
MPPPDRLRAIRHAIATDPDALAKVLKNRKLKQTLAIYSKRQQEGKLARPPKGSAADTPQLEYIKLKSCSAWKEMPLRAAGDTLEQTWHPDVATPLP